MRARHRLYGILDLVFVLPAVSFQSSDDGEIFLATRHQEVASQNAANEIATLEANLEDRGFASVATVPVHSAGAQVRSIHRGGNVGGTQSDQVLFFHEAQSMYSTPLVQRGVLARGILNGSRTMEQEHSAFVHISRHASTTNATIEVEIPTTTTIGWVYAWMFVPLISGWAFYALSGMPTSWYMLLLPMTLCAMVVAQDLVNQALSVVMDAPNAITSIQSTSMVILLGIWSATVEMHAMTKENMQGLMPWLLVALFFVLYQIVNHLVSYWCSLSERVVITNLCPVFSLILEATIMPVRLQVQTSTGTKFALGCMLMGAVCFGTAYSNFSSQGMAAASFLVIVTVGYRLVQRRCLMDAAHLPVAVLASVDGCFLAVPSTVIASTQLPNYGGSLTSWVTSSTVMPMLTLSIGAFTGTHVCGLLILRVGSATSYLVFHNFANFLVVTLGIMFFKDGVQGSPAAMAGLIMSLCGGLWYALEASKKHSSPLPPSRKEMPDNGAAAIKIDGH